MDQKSAKYALWGALLAAIITGGVTLYTYYDGKSEEKKIIELEKKADREEDTANLTIKNVYLPPINTKIDSVFFVEVSNNSLNTAKDLKVKIDFGEAIVSKCEILPANSFDENEKFDKSIIEFSLSTLERNDSFYIYCLISHPTFKSLLITGSNLFSNEYLTYENYRPSKNNGESGFVTFFKVVGSIMALVFVVYFVIVGLILLNRKLKI